MCVDGLILRCRVGDIARAEADGIVSSANAERRMDEGVSAALVKAGGTEIECEARERGGQPLGSCIVTGAGRLEARRVLRAVSARATQRAPLLAEQEKLETLAICAIGTGAARVGLEASAGSMAAVLKLHRQLGGSRLRSIDFVPLDEDEAKTFSEVLESVFPDDVVRDDVGLPDAAAEPADARTVVRRTFG
jgi:O-acetyl-ADP-ribose deacetylase (regulator of RNase III)